MTCMYTFVINQCVTITQYHCLYLITLCQVTSHHTRYSALEKYQQLNMLTLANRTSIGRHTASQDVIFLNSFKVQAAMHRYPSLARLITSTSKGCKGYYKIKTTNFSLFSLLGHMHSEELKYSMFTEQFKHK